MKDSLRKLGNSVSNLASKAKFKIEKHSPEILMVAGIIGVGGTIFMACRATLKAEEVIDRHNEMMGEIAEAKKIDPEYTDDIIKKDKVIAYSQTVLGFARLYAPAFAMGAFSVACILVSNNIMRKRYLGVVAAYNAVSGAFDTYRARVREELGDDADKKFRYGVHKETVTEEVTDENGKKKKVKKEIEVINGQPSDCARYFDESNPNWNPDPALSLYFLKAQQLMANDILQARGHIFLNEVYEMLGFEHTQAGAVVGWVKDGDNGDNYVDFNLYDYVSENSRRFINGHDNVILLDFNHDGVIWNKI